MKRIGLGIVVGAIIFGGVIPIKAGYMVRNQRVSQVTGTQALTSDEIGQVIMANTELIESLRAELAQVRAENQKMRKELDEMNSNMTEFKNLYFRRF